jgi:hypothetical protein
MPSPDPNFSKDQKFLWIAIALILCIQFNLGSSLLAQIHPTAYLAPVTSPLEDETASIPITLDATVQLSGGPEMHRPIVESSTTESWYSADAIGRLAAHKASQTLMMRGDLRADRAAIPRPSKKQQATLDLRSKVQEFRMVRQTQLIASQALELHFGLATIYALEPLQQEVQTILGVHRERQAQAIERGISVLDPTAIDRLIATAQDSHFQTQAKASQIRSQLALFVAPSIACHYIPEPMSDPESSIASNCQMIEWAMSQRCDLAGLNYLRANLNDETLDVARWMSDLLAGSATMPIGMPLKPLGLLSIVSPKEKQARQKELCERLAILDQAIMNLQEKIASEVDIALSKQSSAYSRYSNAQMLIELWRTRLGQLRAYGDQVKANPAEELEAELQLLQARMELVQRQGDWHQAIVELATAVGCIP